MMSNNTAEILKLDNERARRRGEEQFENVGAHLADCRESRGLSLDEAAAKTQIRAHHLAAIEAMNKAGLPARPYALGFVRTYALFLELDSVSAVARFKEEIGYDAPAPVEVEKFEALEEAGETEPGELSLIAIIAIFAFIVWCLWQLTVPREATLLGEAALQPEIAAPVPAPPAAAIVEPRALATVDPVYPLWCAADAAPSETVTIVFNLSATGRVVGERVAGSSNACLNDAALNAMRRWEFAPRTADGAPQPAYDLRHSFVFERP